MIDKQALEAELGRAEARFHELGLDECPNTCSAIAEFNYLSGRIAELDRQIARLA